MTIQQDPVARMGVKNESRHNGGTMEGETIVVKDQKQNLGEVGELTVSTTAAVEDSIARSSRGQDIIVVKLDDFAVTKDDLSQLANDRNDRSALIRILEKGLPFLAQRLPGMMVEGIQEQASSSYDAENPSKANELYTKVERMILQLREYQKQVPFPEHSPEAHQAERNVYEAVHVLCSVLLRSSPETGLDAREVEFRRQTFGTNAIAEKPMESFCVLCWEAVQDFVLIMLIVLAIVTLVVEIAEHGPCGSCWSEGAAILCTVLLVVLLTASIDYGKQFAFRRLNRTLNESNVKQVVRNGKPVTVIDYDIVVGDILSVNSHSLASIVAGCRLENGRVYSNGRIGSSKQEAR